MALPKLNTPVYELTLPSTGKQIRFRPFLVKEHKVLLTMAEASDDEIARIIRELIDSCTFGELNVKDLPHFDIEYIFMMLRAKSIGENVEVIVNCDCGHKIEASFDIEKLEVVKPENHSNKIMVGDEVGVEMRYPGIDEVVRVFVSESNDSIFDLVVKNIKGIFDSQNYWEAENQSKEELLEFIESLTKEQFGKIEQFFATSPKIVQTVECDCPECGKHNVSKIEGLQNFFV